MRFHANVLSMWNVPGKSETNETSRFLSTHDPRGLHQVHDRGFGPGVS